MTENFWDNVQKKAYYKYMDKMQHHLADNTDEDWEDAVLEESLESKIAEEAYLQFTRGYNDPLQNWEHAKKNVLERVRFLAYYCHENDINKTPEENWKEAEKIYIDNF